MKKRISISIDGIVLAAIEKKRGSIPRSTYLNEKLRNMFNIKTQV